MSQNYLPTVESEIKLPEPLAQLARFAFDWAETLCKPKHECFSYHRLWSLVRLIEADGALPAGEIFFRRQVKACSRNGKIHALISGGADTGVMALAVESALKHGLDIRISAIDRCDTPLQQMRLYGNANRISVDTYAISLDQIPRALNVDIILCHSILSHISRKHYLAVFRAWNGALRPGGRVVMSQRLATNDDLSRERWTKQEVFMRRQRLSTKLDELNIPVVASSKETVLDAAECFWKHNYRRSKVSKEDILSNAVRANLNVLQITPVSDSTNLSPFSFTNLNTQRLRHEIILEKPQA